MALVVACGACGGSSSETGASDAGAAPTTGADGSTTSKGHDAGAALADAGGRSSADATTPSGGDATTPSSPDATVPPPVDATTTTPSACSGATLSKSTAATAITAPALSVPSGFVLEAVASVPAARQLAALPNGDLLVATNAGTIYIVPNADSDGAVGEPVVFATSTDTPAQGIAFDTTSCTIFVGAQHGVYSAAYADAQLRGTLGTAIASVRTGAVAPNSDGDIHTSTSVAVAGGALFAGVGSSCNACTEVDPTRATIQQMNPDGSQMKTRATRIRNAIALAENPATGTLWAGGAGQDDLTEDHPYEFFDAVTSHSGVADYGWPDCEEDHVAYTQGSSCASTVAPVVELPAYSTLIGSTFYPTQAQALSGAHAFPQSYRGGLFVTAHGSWHQNGNVYIAAPLVAFVAMKGDTPVTPVDWSDPTAQWTPFVGGFQSADGTSRIARPTGIAVGPTGSLFVADDQNGRVYRVRPK